MRCSIRPMTDSRHAVHPDLEPDQRRRALARRAIPESNVVDYLALHWPNKRDVVIGLVVLVGIIALSDALLYLSGHALVTPFRRNPTPRRWRKAGCRRCCSRRSSSRPAGEEIMFRGFILSSFARSERAVWPAIDYRDLVALGRPSHPIRLDRHIPDIHDRPVSRLNTLAQQTQHC